MECLRCWKMYTRCYFSCGLDFLIPGKNVFVSQQFDILNFSGNSDKSILESNSTKVAHLIVS